MSRHAVRVATPSDAGRLEVVSCHCFFTTHSFTRQRVTEALCLHVYVVDAVFMSKSASVYVVYAAYFHMYWFSLCKLLAANDDSSSKSHKVTIFVYFIADDQLFIRLRREIKRRSVRMFTLRAN
ncbi:hypothetical protein J6590_002854 [Homalodisca vitripennis]|nr:hypothetical protein J6590_002854 [Homalodisca vitripennis]